MCIRQPNREDIQNIVHRMYEKDGISRDEVERIVDTFPNQGTYLCFVNPEKFYLSVYPLLLHFLNFNSISFHYLSEVT